MCATLSPLAGAPIVAPDASLTSGALYYEDIWAWHEARGDQRGDGISVSLQAPFANQRTGFLPAGPSSMRAAVVHGVAIHY